MKVLVDSELLALAVSIPSKASIRDNEKGIVERGLAQQRIRDLLAQPAQQQPVAYMLSDAVGGSALEFQQHELYDIQRRYGGHIGPLYLHPAPADTRLVEALEIAFRKMRNVAAGYSNLCDYDTASARRLEREFEEIDAALAAAKESRHD